MKKQLTWSIFKEFMGKNKLGFTTQDVIRAFPERNRLYLTRLIAEMVRQGMLLKVVRDRFLIIPFNADPESYVPDKHLVAKYIMQNKEYYIGHASAMEIHGLTHQSADKEYVVTKSKFNRLSEHTLHSHLR